MNSKNEWFGGVTTGKAEVAASAGMMAGLTLALLIAGGEAAGLVAQDSARFVNQEKQVATTQSKFHCNTKALTPDERAHLRITTIRARAMPKRDMEAARRERARVRGAAKRRAKGVKPRAKYESESLARTQPWKAQGISRATWFRRRKRGCE